MTDQQDTNRCPQCLVLLGDREWHLYGTNGTKHWVDRKVHDYDFHGKRIARPAVGPVDEESK